MSNVVTDPYIAEHAAVPGYQDCGTCFSNPDHKVRTLGRTSGMGRSTIVAKCFNGECPYWKREAKPVVRERA